MLAAARVSVLVPAVLLGLKDAVTPAGNPDADKFTIPAKPLSGVTVIALVPLLPCVNVTLFGLAVSAKLGAGTTVRLTDVPLLKLLDVPVIVTVNVPVAAALPALKVSVLVPDVLAGLKLAVTPAGRPAADKLTASLKPF